MGPRPSLDHSIERIDVDGNYCKENCKWADKYEQARNTRRNVKLWYKGREMLQCDIVKEIGVEACTFIRWLKCGLTPDEIGVYYKSGKRYNPVTVIPCIFKAAEFNGDFTELIPHGDYVVVSATDMGCGDILYKLVAKGKPKNYPHLLQV